MEEKTLDEKKKIMQENNKRMKKTMEKMKMEFKIMKKTEVEVIYIYAHYTKAVLFKGEDFKNENIMKSAKRALLMIRSYNDDTGLGDYETIINLVDIDRNNAMLDADLMQIYRTENVKKITLKIVLRKKRKKKEEENPNNKKRKTCEKITNIETGDDCMETFPCRHNDNYITTNEGTVIELGTLNQIEIRDLHLIFNLKVPKHFEKF